MPYTGEDFSVADPQTLEKTYYSFDFTDQLSDGESIQTQQWTLSVASNTSGVDPLPSSHLIGSASLLGSIVTQLIGGLLPGVKYRVLVTVSTNHNQIMTAFSFVNCE